MCLLTVMFGLSMTLVTLTVTTVSAVRAVGVLSVTWIVNAYDATTSKFSEVDAATEIWPVAGLMVNAPPRFPLTIE